MREIQTPVAMVTASCCCCYPPSFTMPCHTRPMQTLLTVVDRAGCFIFVACFERKIPRKLKKYASLVFRVFYQRFSGVSAASCGSRIAQFSTLKFYSSVLPTSHRNLKTALESITRKQLLDDALKSPQKKTKKK